MPAKTQQNALLVQYNRNLNTREAAKILNVSIAWMERQRWLGTGPQYIKVGRAVRYPENLLHEYLAVNLVKTAQRA